MSKLALFTTALLAASIPFVDAAVAGLHGSFKISFGDPHGISPPASGGVTQPPKMIGQTKIDQVTRTEFSIPQQLKGLNAKPLVGPLFTPAARPFAALAGVTTGKGTYKPAEEGTSNAKRSLDLQGAPCTTICGYNDRPRPNQADCAVVYRTLYNHAVAFDSRPYTFVSWSYNSCSALFINNSRDVITYDQWDYGGVTEWLNGDCIGGGANIGTCLFSRYNDYSNGAYISVNNPNYFG